jgi:hypothetical protein
MKKGYKDKTGVFGTDAEKYFSRLFMMLQNPNGSRRPDFITLDGQFDPRLSIELKSGRDKGVLVDYQLHYAVTSERDYVDIFGEKPSIGEETLPGIEFNALYSGPIRYYYDLLNRTDKISAEELDRPFANIKLKWGDHYIFPPEMGFCAFAISRMMRTGESFEQVTKELSSTIKEDIITGSDNYLNRKGMKQSWQNIYGRDLAAIYHQDDTITTKDGKERVELLKKNFAALDTLKRITIAGPNDTNVYVFSKPEDVDLFDRQVRRVIEQRKKTIEKLIEQRKESEGLLDKIEEVPERLLFIAEADPNTNHVFSKLKSHEIELLRRLSNWLDEGEDPISLLPEKPNDDIPF